MTKFQKRYWNEQTQHKIKRKPEFGCYQPNKDRSRAEYARKIFALVSEPSPTLDQAEIIRKLACHYNDVIKYSIIGRGIHGCEQLIELLDEFDKIGSTNSGTQERREWRNNSITDKVRALRMVTIIIGPLLMKKNH